MWSFSIEAQGFDILKFDGKSQKIKEKKQKIKDYTFAFTGLQS